MIGFRFLHILPFIFYISKLSLASTISDWDRLYNKLLANYSKNTRGTNNLTIPTNINFTFHLRSLSQFSEVNGKLSVVGFFKMFWTDERMVWNPADYNGIEKIQFQENTIWTPLIILSNSHDSTQLLGNDRYFVMYDHRGTAEWTPADIYRATCYADIYKYPFDTQVCKLTFVPWGYYTYQLRFISFQKNEVQNLYLEHGIWSLNSVTAYVETIPARQVEMLHIEISISRRWAFFLLNMILPVIILGLLNIFVFLLPANSGERIGYTVTVLLSIAVYQTITSEGLPNVSKPNVSILCVKLVADLIVSSVITILTIIGLTFYNQPSDTPIPSCLVCLTNLLLCNRSKTVGHSDDCDTKNVEKCHGRLTWFDVGKASDVLFASLSFLAFVITNTVFILII